MKFISKKVFKETIRLYKKLKQVYLIPLDAFIENYSITIKIILQWLRTRLAIKYNSTHFYMNPKTKNEMLRNQIPQYMTLDILYIVHEVTITNIIEFLERKEIILPATYMVELLLILTKNKSKIQLIEQYEIQNNIAELCEELKKGADVTLYTRESYNLTPHTEYNIILNLLFKNANIKTLCDNNI